ncbi:MAG: hypothetical protein JXB32_14520 [Deltaproteobacteria bacterium]|nr:hypothetical protein [Deltaproteobacteria bacterium]
MDKRIVLLGLLCVAATAGACKSSKECPTCVCDGGATPGTAVAASGSASEPAAPGTATAAKASEPSVEEGPSVARQAGAGSEEPGRPPVEPAAGTRTGDLAVPHIPTVPSTPVLPADAPPAGPLAPGLAAHLTRLPSDGELVLVVQADVRALLSAAEVRSMLGGMVELLRGEVPGDPACLVELAASIDLVTVEAVEFRGGNDTAVAIIEGNIDLPGILECAATIAPDEVPREAVAQAARGYVELDRDFVLATLGPRTVAFGGPELVRPIRAGSVPRPLSASAEFEAIRRAVGAGPAYVVALARDGEGGPHDESFTGGAALRTDPRLGVAGSFAFASPAMAGEVIEEFTELLTELDREQAEVLGELRRMPGGATVAGDAVKLFDALRQARLTLQDRTLGFEVWVPEGTTLASLSSSMQRAVPWLLFGGEVEAPVPPPEATVVERVAP